MKPDKPAADAEPEPPASSAPQADAGEASSEAPHPLEAGLEAYPLRDPSEDPRWALWVVWTWIIISLLLLAFIVGLLLAGIVYD